MKNFKIRNFEKHHPSKQFPWFEALDSFETTSLREKLSKKLRLATHNPLSITKGIDNLGIALKEFRPNESDFTIERVLSHLNIVPSEKVYINWHQYDDIDERRFADLANNFEDIWYPAADDIDIFDSSLCWILSISHDGNVKVAKVISPTETN
jgi:hypothetical protein